jgi:ATP-dependent Lhr-like helicase
MGKAFELLHPAVQQKLWDMKWTELRPVQEQGIVHLLSAGGDCIVSSPTASGKTEAAFLPILSAIADEPRGSVRAMYVGPLKALINDQFRRIEDLCSRMDLPVHKWHGDVDASARKNLLNAPGGVLLITPESLEAMFVLRPAKMAGVFARLDYVVIDELHAFLASERGAQLRSQLHRLRLRAGCNPTRIGLSATIGEPERALRWLRPNGAPATLISDAGTASPIAIRVRAIWRRPPSESKECEPDPSLAELGRSILVACHGKTNLVFANSKSRIEEVADELATQAAQMCLSDEIVVHHGSLSKERRESAEARLRQDRPCTAVCSNTLEMGIDIGEIDEVVQVAAPWSVASLTQRLGRSGRRANERRTLRGFFVEDAPTEKSDIWDLLHLPFIQGVAVMELMLEGFVEPPDTGRSHLSTLVHQVLSVLAETGGIQASPLYDRLVDAGSFSGVSRADFAVLLRQLGSRELLEQMPDRTLVLGVEGQKIVEHYTFYAAFNAASELRVVCNADLIGTIAIPPPPGEHLILAGRRWRVEEIDPERQEVLVSPARGRRAPWFIPRMGAIHRRVHEKMRDLLVETNVPTYIDETARDVLQHARVTATKCDGFEPVTQPFEVGVRAFVFGGSRVQQTLSIVLAASGLRYSDEGVGFDVECDPAEFRSVLRSFAESPNEARLAAFADEKMRLRELGREKFERYLPPELWRVAFVRDELDVAEAVNVAALLGK